ncbi:MAG: hypothetical protein RL338_869 [Chloroflexota bacterium]|jgi:2-haloalkanoic acid dehalogenase type II
MIDLADYDALSFDCYGTLIDWEAGILGVLRPWADRHAATGAAVADGALLDAFARHEAREEAADPGALYPEILRRTMRALALDLGLPASDADADALGRSVPDWPAFPDSPAALAALAARFRLVILSNVDRRSFAGSNTRLGVTFDAIVTAEDVGSYKPDPRNFAALLETVEGMGTPRARLLHVAQSLFHDHVPAKAAGLPTVWIDRRGTATGWGATPPPPEAVAPDRRYATLAALADAAVAEVPVRR